MKNHLPLLKALIKFVGPVVGVLMLLAGVPTFEVVRVVAILLVQMAAGVMIWLRILNTFLPVREVAL